MLSWVNAKAAGEAIGIKPRAVQARARRSGWRTREVANPGGGRPKLEYWVEDLPQKAKEALALAAVDRAVSAPDASESRLAARLREEGGLQAAEARLTEVDRLDEAGRARMEARLWALEALGRFAQVAGQTEAAARARFAQAVTDGEIEVPAEHVRWLSRKGAVSVSTRSLGRWSSTLREDGPAALGGGYGARSARDYERAITLENELGRMVIGMLAQRGRRLGPKALRDQAVALVATGRLELEGGVSAVPSEKTFARFLDRLEAERPTTWAVLVDPHTAKGQVMPAFGRRDEDVKDVNELWELDSTLADVVLEDTDWKTGEVVRRRFALVAAVDVFSRRVRFLVSARSSSDSIAAVLRRCMLEWGVPKRLRVDNGKDYTSRHLELVIDEMQIERELCRPYSGDEKPFVERVIGTLQHDGMFKLLPGYAGHDVATRTELDARRRRTAAGEPPLQLGEVPMDRAQFQAFVDDWAGRVYAHREHSALGCTPFERAQQGGRVRRVKSAHALDLLMAKPAGRRNGLFSVQKRGIEYKPPELAGARGARFYYIAPQLVRDDWIKARRDVRCREDLTDLGRLHVSDPDTGRFICWAVCPELADVDRKEIAVRSKRAYQEERSRIIATAKSAARDYAADEALAALREHHAEKTGSDRVAGQIGPVVEHDVPALREAERALPARTQKPRRAAEPTAEELAEADAIAAQAEARRLAEARALEEEAARGEAVLYQMGAADRRRLYASDDDRYVALIDRAGRGEALSADERAFIDHYQTQAAAGGGPARTG